MLLSLSCAQHAANAESIENEKKLIPSKSIITFHNITKLKDGLVDSQINDIIQDSQGIIWIGTLEGLSRFDGHRLTTVFSELSQSEVPDSTNVLQLENGLNGYIWILTSSALIRYNYDLNISQTILKKGMRINQKPISSFLSFSVTNEGVLWLITDIGILKRPLDSKVFNIFNIEDNIEKSFKPLRIFTINQGKVLIGAFQKGLWYYNRKLGKFSQFIQNLEILNDDARNIRDIIEVEPGILWATTNDGLLIINSEGVIKDWKNRENTSWLGEGLLGDLDSYKKEIFISGKGIGLYHLSRNGQFIEQISEIPEEPQSLLSNDVTNLFRDNEGYLWIGTQNHGISILDKNESSIEKIAFDKENPNGIADGYVWSIYQDSQSVLWIGTDKGIDYWDKNNSKFHHIDLGKMPSGDSVEVISIAETEDEKIWLSTGLGLMSISQDRKVVTSYLTDTVSTEGLFTDYIFSLFVDTSDRLWMGHADGVSYLDKNSKLFNHINKDSFENNNLSNNKVGTITEDSQGNVWLGTSKGICKYSYNANNFSCLLKDYGGNTLNDTFLVNSLIVNNSMMWIGYSGNGLVKFNMNTPENEKHEYNIGNGFPSNNVAAILKDETGRLWLTNQNSLIIFNPSDDSYTTIGASDGLGNGEFNESSYSKLKDGRFAFGTVDGVIVVDPNDYKYVEKTSKIFLSGIYSLANQKRILDITKTSLPEEKSGIKINFSNHSYFHPERSRYQYKSGKNKDWIDLGNKSEILFAESTSGTHNIHIRSKSVGGDWGPEKLITFEVYPPLWRNNFFLALYVLLAIGSVVFFMRYRQQQLVEKYKMLDVIKENEQQLRLSLDASEQGVWDWKTKNDFMTRSKTQELLHIEAPNTLVEYWALIEGKDRLEVIQSWNSHLFGKQQNYHCQYRIKLDDEDIWIEEQGRAIERDKHGMAVHISGTYRNITHLKAVEKNLNLLAQAFEDTAEGMLIVDSDLKVSQVNKAVTEITGYPSDSLIGSSISARVSMDSPISFFDEVWQGVAEKGSWQGEVWQKNIEEEDIPLWLNVSEIKDKDEHDTYYVLIMSDMSERKATEEELRYLANYDTLTKLPNRALLRDRLDHALGNARRQHRPLALLFLDLDRFKNVNDSFGHAVGDGLLKIVSERLQECLRDDDTVSRLGGDEFVILMEHFSSINAIAGVTEKIRIAMTHPFRLEGIDIQASFSIGVSVYPSDGEDSATLLRNADTAMYHAKSAGRNRVQFYAPKMNETALERLTLENDLRSAVGGGQLEVYYQPQVHSIDGSIYGAEALVRWNHPTRGLVMPNDFIPMAEESDLIVGLGNEVLYKACVQMQKWKEQFGLDIKISINLAARQLMQVDLARHIENVVNRAGIDPRLVCLEITETAVMEDLKRARKILDALREKGFKVAIDDFGTGYSSLNYLRNIPLDIIKIDYSFVKELLNNSVDQAIVSAIIEIGAALDLQVLAEGIETIEQKKMLLDKGCEIFQGFYFGKPMPADKFTTYIEDSIATIEAKKLKQKV